MARVNEDPQYYLPPACHAYCLIHKMINSRMPLILSCTVYIIALWPVPVSQITIQLRRSWPGQLDHVYTNTVIMQLTPKPVQTRCRVILLMHRRVGKGFGRPME